MWWRHKNTVITSFKLNLSQNFPNFYEVAAKNFKFIRIDLTQAVLIFWWLFVNKFDSKVDLVKRKAKRLFEYFINSNLLYQGRGWI